MEYLMYMSELATQRDQTPMSYASLLSAVPSRWGRVLAIPSV